MEFGVRKKKNEYKRKRKKKEGKKIQRKKTQAFLAEDVKELSLIRVYPCLCCQPLAKISPLRQFHWFNVAIASWENHPVVTASCNCNPVATVSCYYIINSSISKLICCQSSFPIVWETGVEDAVAICSSIWRREKIK